MTASPFAPRPESAPAKSWHELSKDQQDAIDGIHEYLAEFMKEAPSPRRTDASTEPPHGQFVPTLHEQRLSNILLLDGSRGTGKTTVMLTLLQIWKAAIGAASSTSLLDSIPKKGATADCIQLKQLIPLEILDMQPLSGEPSLLLQLAGRLYRVTEQLQPKLQYRDLVDSKRKPAWTAEADQESASKKAWRQLARTIAVGTEDRPRERQAQLNPEDFALELEQSESFRMRLQERWHAFVNLLCLDLAEKRAQVGLPNLGSKPCFIIPIDDADMNPDRGVELLNLVRSLWHPHVVFLVTGDHNLFRELLVAHYAGPPSRLPTEVASRLARDVLGKAIPPGQRLPLRLTGSDIFELRKQHLPSSLKSLLEKYSFLRTSLPRRWRVVRDLERFSSDASSPSTMATARILLQEAVYDSALSQKEQEQMLSDVLGWNSERQDLEFLNENHLQMLTAAVPLSVSIDTKRTVTYYTSPRERWILRRQEQTFDPQMATPLSESIVAALYLLSSLAARLENARQGISLSPQNYPIAQSTFAVRDINYEFPWPTPIWVNPLDFRGFIQEWHLILRKVLKQKGASIEASNTRREVMEQLSADFLSITIMIAAGYADDAPCPKCNTEMAIDWFGIGRQIAWLATCTEDGNPVKSSYIRWGQTEALFFAAKESGLNSESRGQLLDGYLYELGLPDKQPSKYWNLVKVVKDARIERFKLTINTEKTKLPLIEQVDQAIQEIDVGFYSSEISKSSFRLAKDEDESRIIQDLISCIDFMSPESEDTSIERAMNYVESTTYHGLFFGRNHTPEQLRNNHFIAHARLYTKRIFLRAMPEELPVYWRQLWPRIKFETTELFYQRPDLLAVLRDAIDTETARRTWRQVIENHIQQMTGAELAKIQAVRDFLSSIDSTASEKSLISFSWAPSAAQQRASSRQYALVDYMDEYKMIFDLQELPEVAAGVNDEKSISRLITRLIERYHDIVVDEDNCVSLTSKGNESSSEISLPWPVGIKHLSKEHWSVQVFPIIIPYWPSVIDHELSLRSYGSLRGNIPKWWLDTGNDVTSALGVAMPEGVAYCILSIFVIIAQERRSPDYVGEYLEYVREIRQNWKLNEKGLLTNAASLFWGAVNKRVSTLYYKQYQGRRWEAVRTWADLGAPLFATPECGMDTKSAEQWLRAWDSTPNSIEVPEVRRRLRESRRKRAAVALQRANKPAEAEDVAALIRQVDQDYEKHAWVQLIENRE
ncbi:MAG: hypothetical protein U1A78_30865 [Polyangia bacterium]